MAGYIGSKASVVSSGAERKKVFDITTTTTSLTGCSYTPNQVHVYHNGVRLVDGTDYTATDGSTVTLTTAAQSGDEMVVISYATFQTSDTVSASAGGTFSNAVTIDADGATVLTVDRATSDGTIIDLQKDGSSVGSVGVRAGDLFLQGTDTTTAGIKMSDGAVRPCNADGSNSDNDTDLGTSGTRFKDLYLSGGAYLGGTGSDNYLDDYEEGTFTPAMTGIGTGTSTGSGYYTKIGRLVYVAGKIAVSNTTGTSNLQMTGFPFAGANNADAQTRPSIFPEGDWGNLNSSYDRVSFRMNGSSAQGVNGTSSSSYLNAGELGSSFNFNFSVVYHTS